MFRKLFFKTIADIPKDISGLPTPERRISATYYFLGIMTLAGLGYFMWHQFDNSDKLRMQEKDKIIIEKDQSINRLQHNYDSLILKNFSEKNETINELEKLKRVQEDQKQQLRKIK